MTISTHLKTVLSTLILCGIVTSASAQYMWLDEKGGKQFSDMPPPPSIPKKNILKSPSGALQPSAPKSAEVAQSPASIAASIAASAAASVPMTTAEKNADYNKRKIAEAEKEKKASDQAKLDADKAKNCERTKMYKRALDSGERIGQLDKNGDRQIMNDEQRARETKDANSILEGCK